MYWPVLGLGIRGQIKQLTNTPCLPPVPRSRIQILSCPFQIDQIPPKCIKWSCARGHHQPIQPGSFLLFTFHLRPHVAVLIQNQKLV